MRTLVTIAILFALVLAAGAQDQPLRPVLIDDSNVIIYPNPHVFAAANNICMTTDPLYDFITDEELVTAATNAVGEIAALNLAITNLPASSITSGNIAVDRLGNALVPNETSATVTFTDAASAEHEIVLVGGQVVSWTITPD